MSKPPSKDVDTGTPSRIPSKAPERHRRAEIQRDDGNEPYLKRASKSKIVESSRVELLSLPTTTDVQARRDDTSHQSSKRANTVNSSKSFQRSSLPTLTDLKIRRDDDTRQTSEKSEQIVKPPELGKRASRLVTTGREIRRGDENGQSSKKYQAMNPSSLEGVPSYLTRTDREVRRGNEVGQMVNKSKLLQPTTALKNSQRRLAGAQNATQAPQPFCPQYDDAEEITTPVPSELSSSTHIYVPPLPSRNPRRKSISIEDVSSANGSSIYSSPGESPSSSYTRSAPYKSIKTSEPPVSDRRTPEGKIHSPVSRAASRDRSMMPPVSLMNAAAASAYRPRLRPRVGSFNFGDVDTTSAKSNVAAPARRGSAESLQSIRNNVMVNYLYQQASQRSLLTPMEAWQGVVLKRARGDYACCPPELSELSGGLHDAVLKMNVRCAMTVDTHVTQTIVKSMAFAEIDYVPLPGGLRVQVIKRMADLPACQLHQFAAFVAELEVVVIWDDDPENLLARAEDLQAKFVKLIWANGNDRTNDTSHSHIGDITSVTGDEKTVEPGHLEAAREQPRQVVLNCALITGFTLCLILACLGTGWRKLAMEVKTDGRWQRLALLATAPIQVFASMFFFQAFVGNVCQMLGPISHLEKNSKCYSGKAPARRLQRDRDYMPHLTIQMPVYKEGLRNVIRPTILAVKAAISTYEMQGGTASIFVNDDGMQLISAEAAQARRDFYDEHQIGWVARPGHGSVVGPEQKPFCRRGKFKKASNMNFCLDVSNRLESRLGTVLRSNEWTQQDEDVAYERSLAAVLEEDQGRTWAEGNIRIGDHILIIDSDTRMPKDCLLDAMSEMEQSPEVAIIQFRSGVMNVTDSSFEHGMTWFTDMIYTAITWAVAGGDATPFVGHNAILRWSAIQSAAAYHEPEDGYEKYWSEDHVSEDFAMALRMLTAGYVIRYASYMGDGFKEGVSLTVYDELARWEKYAYGVNEVIFHPFRKWVTRSPFTPLFRSFLTNKNIPSTHKLTICAYLGTYYAIASAFSISAMNYFLTGWEYGIYDKFYRDSFSVFFSIVMVFTLLGNVSLATLRYRLKQGGLLENLLRNLMWVPFFTIFLGGVSLHLSQSILCHFFEIDMSWGATSKEAEDIVFGKEVVRILKKFKGTFFICGLSIAVMVYLGVFAPYTWQIKHFPSIFPIAMLVLCHLLLPLLLNPSLMRLSW